MPDDEGADLENNLHLLVDDSSSDDDDDVGASSIVGLGSKLNGSAKKKVELVLEDEDEDGEDDVFWQDSNAVG